MKTAEDAELDERIRYAYWGMFCGVGGLVSSMIGISLNTPLMVMPVALFIVGAAYCFYKVMKL